MQYHYLEIVILYKVFDFTVVYLCWQKHYLYLIQFCVTPNAKFSVCARNTVCINQATSLFVTVNVAFVVSPTRGLTEDDYTVGLI